MKVYPQSYCTINLSGSKYIPKVKRVNKMKKIFDQKKIKYTPRPIRTKYSKPIKKTKKRSY